jgi:hypothetical protein
VLRIDTFWILELTLRASQSRQNTTPNCPLSWPIYLSLCQVLKASSPSNIPILIKHTHTHTHTRDTNLHIQWKFVYSALCAADRSAVTSQCSAQSTAIYTCTLDIADLQQEEVNDVSVAVTTVRQQHSYKFYGFHCFVISVCFIFISILHHSTHKNGFSWSSFYSRWRCTDCQTQPCLCYFIISACFGCSEKPSPESLKIHKGNNLYTSNYNEIPSNFIKITVA